MDLWSASFEQQLGFQLKGSPIALGRKCPLMQLSVEHYESSLSDTLL